MRRSKNFAGFSEARLIGAAVFARLGERTGIFDRRTKKFGDPENRISEFKRLVTGE